MPEKVRRKGPPRKIALDNDACLGGFGFLSTLYQMHRYHRSFNGKRKIVKTPKCIRECYHYYLKKPQMELKKACRRNVNHPHMELKVGERVACQEVRDGYVKVMTEEGTIHFVPQQTWENSKFFEVPTHGPYGDSSREGFMDLVIEYYLKRRGARPGIDKFLRRVNRLKSTKKIDQVYMYTSATNVDGWVEFLKDALERYAGVKGVYDRIFTRETIESYEYRGATKKDLLNVATNSRKITMRRTHDDYLTYDILMFDDKPEPEYLNPREGIVCGVSGYYDSAECDDILKLLYANKGMKRFFYSTWGCKDDKMDKFEELVKKQHSIDQRTDMSGDKQADTMIEQIDYMYLPVHDISEPPNPQIVGWKLAARWNARKKLADQNKQVPTGKAPGPKSAKRRRLSVNGNVNVV